MTFYVKYIKGDMYFLNLLSGIFMILGFLAGVVIQKFISVKKTFLVVYAIGVVTAIPLMF